MLTAAELASGKGDHDENFPVAIFFAPKYREAVLRFYRFVRLADDVSDHATAPAEEKLRILSEMDDCLSGRNDAVGEAVALRTLMAIRGITPDHGHEQIVAFKRDCTQVRYADWDDLMDYCRYSAMPVGRYVLDVHGESQDLWPASDALCAALQVINHLQDCAKDFRNLNRVYLPQDMMAAHGADVQMLKAPRATAELLAVIRDTATRNAELLTRAALFARGIRNARLALDVQIIQTVAEDLNHTLMTRDPLCEPVHHSKTALARLCVKAFFRFLRHRIAR